MCFEDKNMKFLLSYLDSKKILQFDVKGKGKTRYFM